MIGMGREWVGDRRKQHWKYFVLYIHPNYVYILPTSAHVLVSVTRTAQDGTHKRQSMAVMIIIESASSNIDIDEEKSKFEIEIVNVLFLLEFHALVSFGELKSISGEDVPNSELSVSVKTVRSHILFEFVNFSVVCDVTYNKRHSYKNTMFRMILIAGFSKYSAKGCLAKSDDIMHKVTTQGESIWISHFFMSML